MVLFSLIKKAKVSHAINNFMASTVESDMLITIVVKQDSLTFSSHNIITN